jgi:catechol 2,3-dioxygenase-like lactoylglutathione lyase family enzyme
MRRLLAVLICVVLSPVVASRAQVFAPNAAGVAMSHLHTIVRDVDATKRFWTLMGATPIKVDGIDVMKFPGVLIFLHKGEPSGSTMGSRIDHVGFNVVNGDKLVVKMKAAGVKTDPTAGTRAPESKSASWGNVYSPDGLKAEFLERSRLWDGRTQEKALTVPIAAEQIHFFLPDAAVKDALGYYANVVGAQPVTDPIPGPNQVILVPAVELKFSGDTSARETKDLPKPLAPIKGRTLDRIGFEVKSLEAFCKKLESTGVKFDKPYSKSRYPSYASAEFTDPWGVTVELTEGLNRF